MYQLLIVDDEPLVQAGIRSMLNWNEMNIEICGTAMNGQAALKIIEEKSTDIVITDIKMPVMNVWSLRKHAENAMGITALILSSSPAMKTSRWQEMPCLIRYPIIW